MNDLIITVFIQDQLNKPILTKSQLLVCVDIFDGFNNLENYEALRQRITDHTLSNINGTKEAVLALSDFEMIRLIHAVNQFHMMPYYDKWEETFVNKDDKLYKVEA